MRDRIIVAVACFDTTIHSLSSALAKADPTYVPAHWFELPWWIVLLTAPFWLIVGYMVIIKGVK